MKCERKLLNMRVKSSLVIFTGFGERMEWKAGFREVGENGW